MPYACCSLDFQSLPDMLLWLCLSFWNVEMASSFSESSSVAATSAAFKRSVSAQSSWYCSGHRCDWQILWVAWAGGQLFGGVGKGGGGYAPLHTHDKRHILRHTTSSKELGSEQYTPYLQCFIHTISYRTSFINSLQVVFTSREPSPPSPITPNVKTASLICAAAWSACNQSASARLCSNS